MACLTARFATTDRCTWLRDYEAHVCVEPLGSRYGFAANFVKWYFFVSPLWAPCRACRCAMQRMTTPCVVAAVATRTTNLENVPMCTFSTFSSGSRLYLSSYRVLLHRTVKKISFGLNSLKPKNRYFAGHILRVLGRLVETPLQPVGAVHR